MKLRRFNENDEFEQEPIEGLENFNYEDSKKRAETLRAELYELDKKIHEYENSERNGLIPELDMSGVQQFICERPKDGTKFKYIGPTRGRWINGDYYKVDGIEEFIDDYGFENGLDGVYNDAYFNDLLDGGSFGLVYRADH